MSALAIAIYEEESVAFPTSMIKSPGGLLRKVKTENQPKGDIEDMSTDIETFESTQSPFSPTNSSVVESKMFFEIPERRYRQLSELNVNFKSLFSSSLASSAQDFIVKELNQLPSSFVISLQMRIIFSDRPSMTEERYTMRSADFKNTQKAKERLYSIIFTTFLNKFPKVSSMWNKIINKDNNPNSQNMSEEMRELNELMREREIECSFFAIMMNKKYSKALNIVKFKELLIELDPASFTQEWFKDHNKELKKGYRVRFSGDYSN